MQWRHQSDINLSNISDFIAIFENSFGRWENFEDHHKTPVLSYFHRRNNITASLELERLQRNIYKDFLLLRWSPHFSAFARPKNNPLKSKCKFNGHHLPPPLPPWSNSSRYMNPVFSNFHSFNPVTTSQITWNKIYWSPQIRYLIACSNFNL